MKMNMPNFKKQSHLSQQQANFKLFYWLSQKKRVSGVSKSFDPQFLTVNLAKLNKNSTKLMIFKSRHQELEKWLIMALPTKRSSPYFDKFIIMKQIIIIIQLLLFRLFDVMSLFILTDWEFYCSIQKSPFTNHIDFANDESGGIENNSLNNIKSQIKKHKQHVITKVIEFNGQKQYALWFIELSFGIRGLFSMKLNKSQQELSFWIDLLTPKEQYFKIGNLQQMIQICRNIQFQHSKAKYTLARLGLNINTRQIKIQLPLYLNPRYSPMETSGKENLKLISIYKTFLVPHISSIEYAIKCIFQNEQSIEMIGNNLDTYKQFDIVHKYNQMLNVTSHLCSHYQSQQLIVQNSILQKQSIAKIKCNKVRIQPNILKSTWLFNKSSSYQHLYNQEKDYGLSTQQEQMIKMQISMPIIPKNKNPIENSMILNYIFLNRPSQIESVKVGNGGFSNIYFSQLSFWYVYSTDQHQFMTVDDAEDQTDQNLIRKPIIIKKQISSQNKFKKHSHQSKRNRHQIKIIQQIKNGTSIFFPKYYIPINKPNPLQHCLLMDYIPFKTLGQFLNESKNSLALVTKLGYMFSICQALRYLRDYKIVHLDLKPNNIMIYWNLLIKLIDFGQSYHPDVCKSNHKPGFTIPYSSPEIYTDQQVDFTNKSDVFSMGVIFYQMLFDRNPFEIYKNTTFIDFQMKKYLEYWYYTPEQFQNYGDGQVLRILVNIISKCISVNPQDRPELDWIAIILRYLCEIVY